MNEILLWKDPSKSAQEARNVFLQYGMEN
jgi:hypothetical protein